MELSWEDEGAGEVGERGEGEERERERRKEIKCV